MPDRPFDQQLWRNLGFIRSQTDRQYVIDVFEARRDFLRLRQRQERAIRQVYIRAAEQVAKDLRNLKPTVGKLTRNHLTALEKALNEEVKSINQALSKITKEGIEEAVKLGARPLDNHLLRAMKEADTRLDFLRLQRGFANVNRAAVEAIWARTHRGLRVSDRIWRSSERARDSMRDVLTAGIAAGRDTVQIARDLKQYVQKGVGSLAEDYPNMMARMGRRIPKDLSYEALRLVRTERAKAYTEGVYSRGRVNPSYRGSKWMLSDAHPIRDVCDDLAAADLYKMGPGVYPKGQEPVIPHPNCLCFVIPVLLDAEKFIDDLIAWKNDPTSQPYLEEWYNEVYRPIATGTVPITLDPLGRSRSISLRAAASIRLVGEELREATVREGVEFAAMVDAQTGIEVGGRLRGTTDAVMVGPHITAMEPRRMYVHIHTHPTSSSFSSVDAALLVEQEQLQALHVVGADGTKYLLSKKPADRYPSRNEIQKIFWDEVERLRPKYQPLVQSGQMSAQAAWREHSDEAWSIIADQLQLVYERWDDGG